MSKDESLQPTPEFSVNESEGVFSEINKELKMDTLGREITPNSFDGYTGEDLRNNPEQSICRKTLVEVTRDMHGLLGVRYDATESPLSGNPLPELPNLKNPDVKGGDYTPYLERVRVLKDDIEKVVQRVEADGAEVPKFDADTGERLPDDSLNKLSLCLQRYPAETAAAMNSLRQATMNKKVDETLQTAKQDLTQAYEGMREQARTHEPDSNGAPKTVGAQAKPPVQEQQPAQKPLEASVHEQVGSQTQNFGEYMGKLQEEAFENFAKGMGMEVTEELRGIFRRGGTEALVQEYLKQAKEKARDRLAQTEREMEVVRVQAQIDDKVFAQVEWALREGDDTVLKNLRDGTAAINTVFARGPNGEKGDLGTARAVKVLTGKGLANEVMRDHPDLAPTMDGAYGIVFDNGMVEQSVRLSRANATYKPTEDDITARRKEMIAVAEDPKTFLLQYKEAVSS